jgi:putative peptidoglycan lipid II flippase
MGGALAVTAVLLIPALMDPVWRYGALGLLIAVGGAVYFASGAALGAFKLSDFRRQR